MDVKSVVTVAKQYVRDVFADEHITNVGLEELEFDEGTDEWRVTIGFSRPWSNRGRSPLEIAANPFAQKMELPSRDYRVVSVGNADGTPRSLKIRELAA